MQNIATLLTKYTDKQVIQDAYAILYVVLKDFIIGRLPLRATSLVYTTILSFAPLLALSFSVLKSFGVHNQLKPFLEETLAPLGQKGLELTTTIVGFVDNIQVGVLGAVGLGFLIFTVVSLIQKIEDAFNDIWHIHRIRNAMQRFTGYLSVVTIGPIIAFSLLSLKTQFTTNPYVAEIVGVTSSVSPYASTLVDFVSGIAVPVILFTLMNKFIPNTNVKWKSAFVAGIITAVLWRFAAEAFGTFISGSVSYDAIYSSFAIILISFIWLYLNWLIILIGGSFCYYLQNSEQAHLNQQNKLPSHTDTQYIALVILKEVTHAFKNGKAPLTLRQLCEKYKCETIIYSVIEKLVGGGILLHGEEDEIVLTRDPKHIYLSDVFKVLIGESLLSKHLRKDKAVNEIVETLYANYENKTLMSL